MSKFLKLNRFKLILGTLAIVLILIILIYLRLGNNLRCEAFSCLVFPDKNLWQVKDTYKQDNFTWNGIIGYKDYEIRLYKQGNVKPEDAKGFTKVTTMRIEGLFDTARSPYAGEISDKITCPDNLKPVQEDFTSASGVQIHFMASYLNDRLQYGACTETQVSYKVFSGMFYCSNVSEWYQIELIVPLKSAANYDYYRGLFLKAGCQRPSVNTGRLFP